MAKVIRFKLMHLIVIKSGNSGGVSIFKFSVVPLLCLMMAFASPAQACGGFFCQLLPINQAAEQIVFRQDGNDITAMVRILYQGEAEAFSWIVPVPDNTMLDGIELGADATFLELNAATQPNFVLRREGNECEIFDGTTTSGTAGTTGGSFAPTAEEDSGVSVEESDVGPFTAQLISSTNPDELATWLIDNDYQVTDRGRDLIEPYVTAGMKFVGLKLRRGQSAASVRPIIMRYQSDKLMIPIRLTAIAAEDDMGVVVWVVGDARAVPDNYLHVIPNYTRLNWYVGSQNAYASYQTLITQAMNDAGGQGFATDMANSITSELTSRLTTSSFFSNVLANLDASDSDADFIATLYSNSNFNASFVAELETILPLPAGQDSFVYGDQLALQVSYSQSELATARPLVQKAYTDYLVDPLSASVGLIAEGKYLTRLYTTLSADEMTVDPTFVFNSSMPDQSATREALLTASCENDQTNWKLTLGAGTGREGEVVIDADMEVPFVSVPQPVTEQLSIYTTELTSEAAPQVTRQNTFEVLRIGDNGTVVTESDNDGLLGATSWLWLSGLGLILVLRRRIRTTKRKSRIQA